MANSTKFLMAEQVLLRLAGGYRDVAQSVQMEDVVKEGDVLTFKVMGRDPKTKKWKLSRKVLLPRPERKEEAPQA
jgi:ribosomal protein S1